MDVHITDPGQTAKIREINDRFRSTFTGAHTEWVTNTVIPPESQARIMDAIRLFDDFGEDPSDQRSFAFVEVDGVSYVAFMQYYPVTDNAVCLYDPTDPVLSFRAMLIMREDGE
jgi:hypothetical protein